MEEAHGPGKPAGDKEEKGPTGREGKTLQGERQSPCVCAHLLGIDMNCIVSSA